MLNKVLIIGNLGRDPEVRTTQIGSQVATLNVATSERQKGRDGNWEEHTEWHRIVCFGKTAENVARFLKKGRTVYVEGKIRTNKWKDKDGQDRYTTEIRADVMKMLGSKGDGQQSEPQQRQQPTQRQQPPKHGGAFDDFDDSIPF